MQLLRLYERNVREGSDPESVPADVVHHFLLALCSHPGVGLCFHDRGWYPRETDLDQKAASDVEGRTDGGNTHKGGKIYNKILANVVKTLKVNEDPRQQELALKILAACPELVSGWVFISISNSRVLAHLVEFLDTGLLPALPSSPGSPPNGWPT